jgi:hypothetical protein
MKDYNLAIEILEETGSIPVESIENLTEFISDMADLGHELVLDPTTDYLIETK